VGQVDGQLATWSVVSSPLASALSNWISRREAWPRAARTPMVRRRRSTPVQLFSAPDIAEEVIDRVATEVTGQLVGIDGEVVDLFHLGQTSGPTAGVCRTAHAGFGDRTWFAGTSRMRPYLSPFRCRLLVSPEGYVGRVAPSSFHDDGVDASRFGRLPGLGPGNLRPTRATQKGESLAMRSVFLLAVVGHDDGYGR